MNILCLGRQSYPSRGMVDSTTNKNYKIISEWINIEGVFWWWCLRALSDMLVQILFKERCSTGLRSLKAITCDSHYFHTHQTILWPLVHGCICICSESLSALLVNTSALFWKRWFSKCIDTNVVMVSFRQTSANKTADSCFTAAPTLVTKRQFKDSYCTEYLCVPFSLMCGVCLCL